MERKIRWGIMGTGRMAKKFCDMLALLEEAELCAVGSRKKETAEAFAENYRVGTAYGSYEELLADERVELVYVATPIGSHFDHVRLCLAAGKHVLCEKAMTRTAREAVELERIAREKGLFLMEAMWMKCQPVFRRIFEWSHNGRLGEIRGVEAKFYTMATREHRLMKDKNQGGSLYDLMIYPITFACALLGYEPKHVHALAALEKNGVDTMESIQLEYENGAFASLTGGLSLKRQTTLYIHGTEGRILIDGEHFFQSTRVALLDWSNETVEEFEEPFTYNGYEYEAREAMKCIREGRNESPLVPLSETSQVICLMEECRKQFSHTP